MDVKAFETSDGARIAYREAGVADGVPLLLLHGMMAHGGFFMEQAPLGDTFRLITVDLRGHGESVTGLEPISIDRMARDVVELIDALDLQGAIIVGWSLGATVMWDVLTARPDRFVGSVVVDMTARVCNGPDWNLGLSPEACDLRSTAMRIDFEQFAMAAGGAIFAPPADGSRHRLADWSGAEFARNDPAAIAATWASLVKADARPLLPAITQPTLIIHGAQSALYGGETAAYLAQALPHARIARFAYSGHAPQIDEPALFNTHVTEFAAGLNQPRRHATA